MVARWFQLSVCPNFAALETEDVTSSHNLAILKNWIVMYYRHIMRSGRHSPGALGVTTARSYLDSASNLFRVSARVA